MHAAQRRQKRAQIPHDLPPWWSCSVATPLEGELEPSGRVLLVRPTMQMLFIRRGTKVKAKNTQSPALQVYMAVTRSVFGGKAGWSEECIRERAISCGTFWEKMGKTESHSSCMRVIKF